jgi:hypothetical protein
MVRIYLFTAALLLSLVSFGQDDLLSMVDDGTKEPSKKVYATFKTYRLGNGQSVETVKKKNLDYRIGHRFGNLYNTDASITDPLNTAAHNAFGFDAASDIRNSFDYGITDNLTIGIGRSRMRELVDGSFKWKFLTQTSDFKVPVSMALFGSMGYTTMKTSQLYSGIVKDFPTNEAHRVNYFASLIIACKMTSWLSLQVSPSYYHRNYIMQAVNINNGKEDVNGFFTLGIGGRIKLTKRFCIIGDYFYNFSPFYQNNPGAFNPLALGFEIETGGHIFNLMFTNASGFTENNFIGYTTDTWTKGQIKFGFCISRTFAF